MPRYVVTALIVACALFMENLDGTIIATSLPTIAADLREDPVTLKLALTSYLLSLAVFIPLSGWVSDRFGARRIFRIAIFVFTFGSVLCGLSDGLAGFVGARIVQGMGGAMMVPVGRAVLLRSVDRAHVVRALSYLTLPALLGPAVGPPLGGFITTYFHWRWIFWINVPIGVVGIVLATIFIEDVRVEDRVPLDLAGFLLSASALACLVFGLTVAGRGLLPPGFVVALLATGVAAACAYVVRARHTAHPILDLALLRKATFRTSVIGGSLFRMGIGAIPFLLPLMLQVGFGLNAFQSGAITFISSAGSMAMKITAPPILRRFGFKRVLIWNAIISSPILGYYGFFTPQTPVAAMMALLLVGGFLRSLEFTSLNAIAYAEVDQAAISGAVTFAAVVQQVSLSLGVTLGAGVLQVLHVGQSGEHIGAGDFRWAFIVVALVSVASIAAFLRLPDNAGADLAPRAARA